MRCGTRRLFIYYRVDAAQAEHATAAASSMQQALRERHPGLRAELLRRTENEVTLMEIYAFDAALAPQGIDERLQAEIEALARALPGSPARHVEVFDACA